MFNIVLFNPNIPQNTGNIARSCVATNTVLHLIKPYGFILNDKTVKRAGLDYWSELTLCEYDDYEDFIAKNEGANIYLITTKGNKNYSDFSYSDNDFFIFGSETKGLPDYIHEAYPDTRIRIPMVDAEYARCLNLSNSVGIILYEALRQNNFMYLK